MNGVLLFTIYGLAWRVLDYSHVSNNDVNGLDSLYFTHLYMVFTSQKRGENVIAKHPVKRYKIDGMIDTNLWDKQLKQILEALGFHTYKLKEVIE